MVGGSLIIGMVTIPLMADTILGHSTLEGGLRLMRMTVAIPVGAVLGGLFCQRLDYRLPTMLGLMMIAIGFGFMSYWGVDIIDPAMTIHLLITGFGFGLIVTTSNPKFFKFSIFFLPISVIFSGSQFTKRQLRSNLSLAVIGISLYYYVETLDILLYYHLRV